jgi:hypothetical protein
VTESNDGRMLRLACSGKNGFSNDLSLSDHFQDKKIPVYESVMTQCCPGIGLVVLIQ